MKFGDAYLRSASVSPVGWPADGESIFVLGLPGNREIEQEVERRGAQVVYLRFDGERPMLVGSSLRICWDRRWRSCLRNLAARTTKKPLLVPQRLDERHQRFLGELKEASASMLGVQIIDLDPL